MHPANVEVKPGTIGAKGVIVHGRFSHINLPVNPIVADILLIKDRILVDLRDVIQDEASREPSKRALHEIFFLYLETPIVFGSTIS
jgi:hypothetical protein